MKINKYIALAFTSASLCACTALDEALPEGGTLLESQLHETIEAAPERADAAFTGMYTNLGRPIYDGTPLNFGLTYVEISNDYEGADAVNIDSGYNWFSPCFLMDSRNGDYIIPYNRYSITYNTIADANNVIKTYPEDTEDKEMKAKIAQAKAVRAFAYLHLAPYYQFNYETSADLPCVPIVSEKTKDFANNPRASVKEVYDFILDDLNYAIENLEGSVRSDKSKIDQSVAYALRARTYLYMGMGAEAAADAEKAMEGYTPASIADVSKPAFYNLNEKNWIWGYKMDPELSKEWPVGTATSWLGSFSSAGYSGMGGCYTTINTLLYEKIPDTDVRKGWWVDEDLKSPNMKDVKWVMADGTVVEGNAICPLQIPDVKEPFLPYTSIKFGMKTVGSEINDEDWPWIRVEEMILTQAEGYLISGDEGKAKQILEDFVKTYRDPKYSADNGQRTLRDEIWFQRRVELWGEGFFNADARRLNKPIVRFHGDNLGSYPDKFRFNMAADDPWLLHRFPQMELNSNPIEDNTGGSLPIQDQHPELRDGVTD